MTTEQIILTSRPKGMPTMENFRFEAVELPHVQEGEVLLRGLYYSVDPYMRGRMNDSKSYIPPFQLDKPLVGSIIAEVLESKSSDFKTGDTVIGSLPWAKEFVSSAKILRTIDTTIAPASYYLGVLGMTGLTAYFGLMDICKPKARETVVVSAAAGAVGTIVGQIAKLNGCHVVGITGNDEKAKVLKEEFGFDEVINYKKVVDIKQAVEAACQAGVDIYFDNVGGEVSDAVIDNLNFHARIALCGQIALYNSIEVAMGPRIQPLLLVKSALMQGFIIGNYQSRFPEGFKKLTQWIKEDKLKCTETIVLGFEELPTALLGLFKGENTGKMIVKI
jgi:NADPH-dependent curcumin reductase CurA